MKSPISSTADNPPKCHAAVLKLRFSDRGKFPLPQSDLHALCLVLREQRATFIGGLYRLHLGAYCSDFHQRGLARHNEFLEMGFGTLGKSISSDLVGLQNSITKPQYAVTY